MNKRTQELNQINNSLDKQINPENQEIFTDMICYLRGANISEYDQEAVRYDLTEMVISAQQRGEDISSLAGDDYKEFCDCVIASLPPKTTGQKAMDFLCILCGGLSFLGLIHIVLAKETSHFISNLIAGEPLSYSISFSIGSVISIGLIIAASIIIVEVFLKNAFRIGKKRQEHRMKRFFLYGGLGIISLAIFLIIAWLGSATLFTVNIFLAFAAVLALYIAYKALSKMTCAEREPDFE